jgi:hypothetical protein
VLHLQEASVICRGDKKNARTSCFDEKIDSAIIHTDEKLLSNSKYGSSGYSKIV